MLSQQIEINYPQLFARYRLTKTFSGNMNTSQSDAREASCIFLWIE
jgi:hypothetical protein